MVVGTSASGDELVSCVFLGQVVVELEGVVVDLIV